MACRPNVIFLEFSLNSGTDVLRNNIEGIGHSLLWIVLSKFRICPNGIEAFLEPVNVASDSTKFSFLKILKLILHLLKMSVYIFSKNFKSVIFHSVSLIFKILPEDYLINGFKNSFEVFNLHLHAVFQVGASLFNGGFKT